MKGRDVVVIIGVEPHKRTQTASAVEPGTNGVLATLQVQDPLAGYRGVAEVGPLAVPDADQASLAPTRKMTDKLAGSPAARPFAYAAGTHRGERP